MWKKEQRKREIPFNVGSMHSVLRMEKSGLLGYRSTMLSWIGKDILTYFQNASYSGMSMEKMGWRGEIHFRIFSNLYSGHRRPRKTAVNMSSLQMVLDGIFYW